MALLALEVVSTGRVLPALGEADVDAMDSPPASDPARSRKRSRKGSGKPTLLRAWWHPIPTSPQRAALRVLARELPGAMRAEDRAGRPGVEIVDGILRVLTDHAVRSAAEPHLPAKTRLDIWLGALTGDDAEIPATTPELPALADASLAWRQEATPDDSELRTCFRLAVQPPERGEPEGNLPKGNLPEGNLPKGNLPDGDGPSSEGSDEALFAPDDWVVEFHLQSNLDPSLLVPAELVWAMPDDPALAELGGAHPQDILLRDLWTAACVFPPLSESLESPAPAGWHTDAEGTAEFLAAGAAGLEMNGFGVILPDWSGRPARLGVRLAVTSGPTEADTDSPDSGAGSGRLGTDALLDFDWRLSLGDDPITEDELAVLADIKTPLVRFRGQWTWLTDEAIEAALAFVKRRDDARADGSSGPASGTETGGSGGPGVLDALRLAANLDSPNAGYVPDSLPVVGLDAEGPLAAILEGDTAAIEAPIVPGSFKGTLRPYQERGLAWLDWLGRYGLGGCLADDMGLGKTVQLLALLAADGTASTGTGICPARPTLLVCPTTVLGNWIREAERFVPGLAVHLHHGPGRARGDDLVAASDGCDLMLTTYAVAVRDRDDIASIPWRRVVLDEAQQIKNAGTRTARAVRHIADSTGALRIALTGTPVENRLGDLWALMAFLNPGLLGSARSFRETFSVPIERYGDSEQLELLQTLVRPFLLRRVKTDPTIAPELPAKIERNEVCLLTREQASLYRAVTNEMLGRVDELSREDEDEASQRRKRGIVLAAMLRLKQICNHPALYLDDGSELSDRSGKLERLEELTETILAEGARALVFTQFAGWGEMLRRRLQQVTGREVLFLHGGTPRMRRDDMVERFQSGTGPPIFVISLKAGGVGLNLTAATHVVHYDRWWNPAVENQATDRAYRIGQTRGVEIHRLMCAGTIEERIDALIADKQKLADSIVGSGEGWLARLDMEELRRIVALTGEI
ncbi:MAG: DEAD/DEAH box helicase [Actinobacteria bacterium ATB1]|nr:DEAD/DEAH box helicase [Actinobacteria bacterium ATB1]